ncbi:MAG: homocysteine S-methyltransferase family protein, partial [Firmicutes bacterium]|nr:homocysteine S-methyltransferase family protein [Bacillota bacterium]
MKRTTVEETILKTRIMVTDGAMSTALERLGCDLRDSLWTAKVLAQQPEMIKQVHMDYLRAGADCGITASYQATIPGLMARGYSEQEAEDLIARSVSAFLEARDEWWEAEGRDSGRAWPLCLGSAGPYGAYLADGSEYRGNYGISRKELREFHLRRAEILWEAGSDLLLFE